MHPPRGGGEQDVRLPQVQAYDRSFDLGDASDPLPILRLQDPGQGTAKGHQIGAGAVGGSRYPIHSPPDHRTAGARPYSVDAPSWN